MTHIEIAFICAIFLLYLSDCIFWIGPNEIAFTRSSSDAWQPQQRKPLSFTLLGRLPVIAAPLLVNPGFLRLASLPPEPTQRILRKVSRRLNQMHLLLTLCRMQAFLLLVYLPAVIALHRLSALWPYLLGAVVILHAPLCFFAIRALRRSNATSWRTTATSILLNPLGATRVLDPISQALFDQAQTPSPRAAKSRKA